MKTFIINKNDANQRLDKFISKLMPNLPKSMMYKGLRKNNVRLNGKHCHDGSIMLSENDTIALYFSDELFEKKAITLKQLPKPDIAYEDENILIADKPKGLVCHSDEKNSDDTLLDRIICYLTETGEYDTNTENTFTPALCNRLDRNTSGLIIAAKNADALRIINEKIKTREIEKYYLCRCTGMLPKSEDVLEAYLERKEKIVEINNSGQGKKIITEYKLLKTDGQTSVVEIKLITGRTHQIRAHLSYIGNPLVGDTKYGGCKTKDGYFLKSYKMKFCFDTPAGDLEYLNGMEVISKK